MIESSTKVLYMLAIKSFIKLVVINTKVPRINSEIGVIQLYKNASFTGSSMCDNQLTNYVSCKLCC